MLRKAILFFLFLCAWRFAAGGSRVGLVLSGGGAKGLYHIGVLQALEENEIPVDCIAGTSMGAIIAGLYAAGYTPEEMRELALSGRLREWASGRIPAEYNPYYRQVGQIPASVTLRVNFKTTDAGKKFELPANLLSSTPIDMALASLFAPASAACEGDFDRLMIPFICVAADINSRQAVVLRKGDLGRSIRASMSIPMAFKPVRSGEMLLYDGGVYDNFPWRPLDESFAPDFIIGSKCTEGNPPPTENSSLMDQAFSLIMQETDYTLPAGRSALIDRPLAVGMLDFDDPEAIIAAGYADACAQMPLILEMTGDARRPAAELAARREAFRVKCPPLVFDDYIIRGLTAPQVAYVREFAKLDRRYNASQRLMSYETLRKNLYTTLSASDFSMEYPGMTYKPDTERYTFEVKMSTRANMRLLVGGNISSTAFNQAYIGYDYQHIGRVAQKYAVDLYAGPLYSWGRLGGRTDFYIWNPWFIDYSYNFAVKNFTHGNFGTLTPADNLVRTKSNENFLSLGLGMPVTHRSALLVRFNGGLTNYHYPVRSVLPSDDTDQTRFSFVAAKLELQRNTLDKPLFPRKGSHIELSAIGVVGRDKYRPLEQGDFLLRRTRQWVGSRFSWKKYFDMPGCSWFSFGFNVEGVVTNHPSFSTEMATLLSLPSYRPVTHAEMIFMPDFSARRFVAGGLMPTFDLLPNFFLRTGCFAMCRERRYFSPFGAATDERMHYILNAALVYHTAVGPVSLSCTKYDLSNRNNMYLTFNFGYAIFAPRGIFY